MPVLREALSILDKTSGGGHSEDDPVKRDTLRLLQVCVQERVRGAVRWGEGPYMPSYALERRAKGL